jgi:predicted GH43/DUF377 family glycosyl hydrolase
MITIRKEGVLLQSTDHYFENGGVLNPAIYQEGENVHMFYRGIQNGGVSMIGYCLLRGPLDVQCRADEPLIVPEYAYEAYGVEDPRIVRIGDTWHLTYTACDGNYALGALATSCDLATFEKKGVLVPRLTYKEFYDMTSRDGVSAKYFSYNDTCLWNKNVMFFPRRINGKLCFLHRIRPGILIAEMDEVDELDSSFWKAYFRNFRRHILLDPSYRHESLWIGGGCPPIETPEGWLLIYHGIESRPQGYTYSSCVALLDLDNPRKIIARLPYALFKPDEPWERSGSVSNVVFPSGTAMFGGRLYVYYGSADCRIAVASLDLDELLHELTNRYTHENIP